MLLTKLRLKIKPSHFGFEKTKPRNFKASHKFAKTVVALVIQELDVVQQPSSDCQPPISPQSCSSSQV
ncbi:hypothetical protein ACFX2B_000900 [Malus domestica]